MALTWKDKVPAGDQTAQMRGQTSHAWGAGRGGKCAGKRGLDRGNAFHMLLS